ncbi:hypothetical protein [uncultured Cohaesibacter sp.]|uniref:hypothetical protein n=1 Tax=uncultured Cohaesibacter sp. TaxID=1002546 RepID=UPI002AAAF77E|nr:hypothetical protein [uncultured Cohaesibacter sp.]
MLKLDYSTAPPTLDGNAHFEHWCMAERLPLPVKDEPEQGGVFLLVALVQQTFSFFVELYAFVKKSGFLVVYIVSNLRFCFSQNLAQVCLSVKTVLPIVSKQLAAVSLDNRESFAGFLISYLHIARVVVKGVKKTFVNVFSDPQNILNAIARLFVASFSQCEFWVAKRGLRVTNRFGQTVKYKVYFLDFTFENKQPELSGCYSRGFECEICRADSCDHTDQIYKFCLKAVQPASGDSRTEQKPNSDGCGVRKCPFEPKTQFSFSLRLSTPFSITAIRNSTMASLARRAA